MLFWVGLTMALLAVAMALFAFAVLGTEKEKDHWAGKPFLRLEYPAQGVSRACLDGHMFYGFANGVAVVPNDPRCR